MSAVDTAALRTVRRFTSAGISDCKDALLRHDGDTYLAIRELLTSDEIAEMYRSLQIRNIAPESMKDPPTQDEIRIVERLYRDVILQDQQVPWWRRWLGRLRGRGGHATSLTSGKRDVAEHLKLRVISDYGSTERVAADNATPDIVRNTMNNLDWHGFHQVVLECPNGDWLEVGGSLDPRDGFSVVYEEGETQRVIKIPPTTVKELTEILLRYLKGDTDWKRGSVWE
jgi:hypothetical protein